MKPRIFALAAAAVFGVTSTFTLHAGATPTNTATTTITKPTAEPSPTWGWPQATFKGRTVTVANLKPGWKVGVTASDPKTDKSYSFSAKAKSGSVTIQLAGLPDGTYDFWIDAGDIPANESYYPGIRIGAKAEPTPTRTPTYSRGLASTGA